MRQLRAIILPDMRGPYMKELNTHAAYAVTKQLPRKALHHTKEQCMKESSTLVPSVNIRPLQGAILLSTKDHCMKVSNTLVDNAANDSHKREKSNNTN